MNASKNNFLLSSVHMIIYNSCKWSGCGGSKSYYLETKACQLVVLSAPNHLQSMAKIVFQANVFHLGAIVGQQHTHAHLNRLS